MSEELKQQENPIPENSANRDPLGLGQQKVAKEPRPEDKWRYAERMSFTMTDDKQNTVGIISLGRRDVGELYYNMIQHNMVMILKSFHIKGYTDVAPVQKERIESRNQPDGSKKAFRVAVKGAYETHELQVIEGEPNNVKLTKEDEMAKAWTWLQPADCSWEDLQKMRSEMLADFQKAREAREEELLKQQLEQMDAEEGTELVEDKPKESLLVNMHGAALTKDQLEEKAPPAPTTEERVFN
jgi:hypothetical protein